MTVSVRPRSGWESLDLGFQMARQWWRQAWGIWLTLYVPAAAVALMVFSNKFHAVLVLWWLKPMFDRAVLHGLSRLVFGERAGVTATLRSAGEWLRPGLISALTLRRFEWARSFQLPVTSLEKQTGKSARQRRVILGSRLRGTGVWLTVICLHFEMIAVFSLIALGSMLIPSAGDIPGYPNNGVGDLGFRGLMSWGLTEAICYAAAVSLIEPFYVAAGFSLYLNRRTILEGWDIEIRLRQIGNRLQSVATSTLTALCVAILAATADGTAYAAADTPAPNAAEQIAEVLSDPDFDQHREISRWRALEPQEPGVEEPSRFKQFLQNLALLLADISQGLLWIAMAAVVVILFLALRHYVPDPRNRKPQSDTETTNLFGLNIAPESLPPDISAIASRLAGEGQMREALSLLYRGALSTLVHRHRMTIHAGTTEGECERSASSVLNTASAGYFRTLVATWQQLAYGETRPDQVQVNELCRDWDDHFGSQPGPGAEQRT